MDKKFYNVIYTLEKNHWWFVGRRKIIFDFLKTFTPVGSKRALDIGCGTGFNAQLLKNFVPEVFGLDFSEEAVRLAHQLNPSFQIIHGGFPEFQNHEKYDVITLLDVLEHIPEDSLAVKKIEEMLNDGGIALITVPAFTFLWTEHDQIAHHLRRYTKGRLKNIILKNTTLKIEKISYFNFLLFLPIMLFRLVKRALHLRQGASDGFVVPEPLNSVLANFFSAERWWLHFANLPFGISIICVLRKISG